ncbi:MAG: VWA domain-containing protein [Bacteroidales bacterium]|nr:VWA domain-containing protein [Bacteroidales bacterium]
MKDIEFANPWLFLLLLVLVPLILFYIFKWNDVPTVKTSSVQALKVFGNSWKKWLAHILFGLKMLAVILIVTAMARPQKITKDSYGDNDPLKMNVDVEGIDIMMTIDISSSMLAQDLRPNRLVAAKDAAIRFINNRPFDRIGLVVFSGETVLISPVTSDHITLINFFNNVNSGILEDGTALGDGLANAVSKLKESDAPSKVIILLTDGVNNKGSVNPVDAGSLAKQEGIRIYTVGVGTRGTAPYPMKDMFGNTHLVDVPVEIDESLLMQLAENTGGSYFRATNTKKLQEIYDQIDQLEKTKFDEQVMNLRVEKLKIEEKYLVLVLIALGLLLGESILRRLVLRSIPN